MKLLASKFNEKIFFLRSQLYARAYVRIWTLCPCQILKNLSPLESPMTFPGAILTAVRPRHVNILHSPPPGGALKGSLSGGVPLRSSNPDLFRTKIVHSASQLKTRLYFMNLIYFIFHTELYNFQTNIMKLDCI